MEDTCAAETTRLNAVIPYGPRLVVLGSTSFWGSDSRELCEALAAELAAVVPLVVLTGGMDGVGSTFGRSFAEGRRAAGLPENLFHLLPRGLGPCDTGVTLGAGLDFHERREVLGRIGHVCLVIEGGPGTAHEATVASSRGIPVIPLGRTGGHAGDLCARMQCPPWASSPDWTSLGDRAMSPTDIISTVRRLVLSALRTITEPSHAPKPAAGPVSSREA